MSSHFNSVYQAGVFKRTSSELYKIKYGSLAVSIEVVVSMIKIKDWQNDHYQLIAYQIVFIPKWYHQNVLQ